MRHKAVAAVAIVLLFLAVSLYAQEKTYVGADKCKLCHKIEYTSWAATKHAKAFVEFHRRTGVVREIINLQMLPSGLLGEPVEPYRKTPARQAWQ